MKQESAVGTAQPVVASMAVDRVESESSWGELQDAATPAAAGGEAGADRSGEEEHKPGRRQFNADDGSNDTDAAIDVTGGEPGGGFAEFSQSEEQQQADGADSGNGEQHGVGGDVVMVSPHGMTSEDGGEEGDDVGQGQEFVPELRNGGGDVSRRPNLGALMTMLVVSLRMQRLVHWVVRKRCLDGLSEENLVDLLSALEVMASQRLSCELQELKSSVL